MSILVTGGSGFVGSWVAKLLAEEGEDVIAFDMFERHDDFLSHVSDRITFVEGNILGLAHINEIVRNNPDLTGIVHTAALLGGDVRDNPHFATQINVGGTHNILEVARQVGALKVVYVSSGAVLWQARRTADGRHAHDSQRSLWCDQGYVRTSLPPVLCDLWRRCSLRPPLFFYMVLPMPLVRMRALIRAFLRG